MTIMIFDRITDLVLDDILLRLPDFSPGVEVLAKIEAYNAAGSVKLKTALGLIDALEGQEKLLAGSRVIESSSGNLGIALAIVCAERGYGFTCVCDPNTLHHNVALIRAYGAEVVVVNERDGNGGFLASRLAYVRRRLAEDPGLVWPNQYENPANCQVHQRRTAAAIHAAVPDIDYLFVGVGTSGTLMGCIQYFAQVDANVEIVGVDAEGSVTFGLPAGPRHIPGLGTSVRPPIFDTHADFRRLVVSERETLLMIDELVRRWRLLPGGSTGTVLAGVRRLAAEIPMGSRVVAICPDLGERYLSTIYNSTWRSEHFPALARLPMNSTEEYA
jgi:N-(2-amino-2-carboxyethyl)-L-glutamate synthase